MELLLELGCEEIPARMVPAALEQLAAALREQLQDNHLSGAELRLRALGTPRRLAVRASGLPDRQPDREERVLGPKWEAAWDEQGRPTKACLGFARSKGVEPGDLQRLQTERGEVVGLVRRLSGQAATQVLPEVCRQALQRLRFPKTMRWADGSHAFVRPVHWLCVLADTQLVDVEFAGVRAGASSRGHRFAAPEPFVLAHADEYEQQLERHRVIVDAERRRQLLLEQLRQLSAQVGGRPVQPEQLVDEILYLVELPVAVLGGFDERFLQLPRSVLVAAMRNHQRYFALEDDQGRLLNHFVAVANTPVPEPEVIRQGFERVLVARLNDAEFFYDQDRRHDPRQLSEQLGGMLFQAELGTYGDKVERLLPLAQELARMLDYAGAEQLRQVQEAVRLCKTDLLSEMVGEFPELHGIMGEVYAREAGVEPEVARAVREHVLPRHAGDELPETRLGQVVALADRLDTLAGCFGIGLRPTGTTDPYGLRRQALGVINIVLGGRLRLSLRRALELAVSGVEQRVAAARLEQARRREAKRAARKKQQPRPIEAIEPFQEQLLEQLLEFFQQRLRQRLIESHSARADVVESVLAAGSDDMLAVAERLEALQRFLEKPEFADLAVAFKRVANILKDFEDAPLEERLLQHQAEKRLYQVLGDIRPQVEKELAAGRYGAALERLAASLRQPVDEFFDQVLVNDPDHPELQVNRKALLRRIQGQVTQIADFSRLQVALES